VSVNERFAAQVSVLVEGDEPVLVNTQRARRIFGTDVGLVDTYECRPVTVREILVTGCTHNLRE
jgi:hypothetical protein